MPTASPIKVFGARQHNLKNVDVCIPRAALTVITGVSGSGKSSLAFDTIFAEGQRRYVESLSVQARQVLQQLQRPDVDRIEGLCPTIAIEQRGRPLHPRSTVATATEIYDFLRVLFARVGQPHCWRCKQPIYRQSIAQIVDTLLDGPANGPINRRIMVLAPLIRNRKGTHQKVIERIIREGFPRARVNGEVVLLEDLESLPSQQAYHIDVVVDRLIIKPEIRVRLADSLETAARLSKGSVVIATETEKGWWTDTAYTTTLTCPRHLEVGIDELSPKLFSFSSPQGACEKCHGLGTTSSFDPDLVVPDHNRTLAHGAIAAWRALGSTVRESYSELVKSFCEQFNTADSTPYHELPTEITRILINGTTEEDQKKFGASFEGVIPNLQRRWKSTELGALKQKLRAFMANAACEACCGARLKSASLNVTIVARNIADITGLTIEQAVEYFEGLSFDGDQRAVADPLLREINQRLRFLHDVGVEYLTLNRPVSTLSGGEWQRIRLAAQIGGLSGICYVLDEPTAGLHPQDSHRLGDLLRKMADMDNAVIVVEHDEEIIRRADHLIDIGPGAGEHGGHLIAQGTLDDITASPNSITGKYLSGKCSIGVPESRRPIRNDENHAITLTDVHANNLKHIDVCFPLGCFICVTGLSGSGKSTLVSDVLIRALRRHIQRGGPRPGAFGRIEGADLVEKVIEVDQSPIGRTPRGNPATYVQAFGLIRDVFALTREAKIRGYNSARFSFNVKGGRCEHCDGQGVKRVSMHFLPDVYVTCSHCEGSRYNRETLEIRYRGQTIADVLDMCVEEAVRFFDSFPKIRERLKALNDVGLGYLKLGQSSTTLSGGEAQRIKLAAALHRSNTSQTLYVLDEPTSGLHLADVKNLLTVLDRLVDQGQTVVVIEHHLDVIKSADWVIDLGLEGGDKGGYLVATGTPEDIARHPQSRTGQYLRRYL